MFEATLTVKDAGLLQAYHELFVTAPKVVRRKVNTVVERNADKVLVILRREPGPVKYPIMWTSEKQRRAYFASNGFGRGIPYRRTHKLARAWDMVVNFTSGDVTQIHVFNSADAFEFVEGQFQQRFHAITGWLDAEETLNEASRVLTDEVETALIELYDEVTV